ncbi:MAG: response regulator transcription factor [Vogesella sp.]|uniref:response regulator transcription factor n=1 Tax=Vogesella sp. TaxID=1904252 RepID=UPI00391C61A6
MYTLLISSSFSLRDHLSHALGSFIEYHDSLWRFATESKINSGDLVWVDADNQDPELIGRLCRGDFGTARVIVLSSTPSDAAAVDWLGRGAAGYLHAFSLPETLRQTAAVVESGGLWVGVGLMQQLCARFGQLAKPEHALLSQLTEREREVVQYLKTGMSNKSIAKQMDISERTVKAHLTAIFAKFDVSDRIQLLLKLAV